MTGIIKYLIQLNDIKELITYLKNIDIKDTQTTTKSSTLKADLKKAPSCNINP